MESFTGKRTFAPRVTLAALCPVHRGVVITLCAGAPWFLLWNSTPRPRSDPPAGATSTITL